MDVQSNIKKFSLFVIVLVGLTVSFVLITKGRPSADEYLFGALYQGFYVDYPDQKVFQQRNNLIIDFFLLVQSIIKLGWETPLAALLIQAPQAVVLNYLGPAAVIYQGTIFYIIIWVLLYYSISTQGGTVLQNLAASSIVILGIVFSLSTADYLTGRPNYGIFALIGIRFGVYTVHSLIFVFVIGGVVKWLKNPFFSAKNVITYFFLVGLISFWYSMYLCVFLIIYNLYVFLSKKFNMNQKYQMLKVTLATLGLTLISNFYFFNPPINSGRSRVKESGIFSLILEFINSYLLNLQSRVYSQEIWQLIINRHSLLGLLLGIILSFIFSRKVIDYFVELSIVFGIILFSLPIIYVFQEMITYQAPWHKTILIATSYFIFLFFGLHIGKKSKIFNLLFVQVTVFIVVSIIVFNNYKIVNQAFNTLNQFENNWDNGDPYGVGSPIENISDYNLKNFSVINNFGYNTN